MKELDVVLERFAKGVLPAASSEERQTLARFLELPDPMLVDYLLGQVIPPDAELVRLVQQITASVPSAAAAAPLQSASQPPDSATPSP